MAIADSTSWTQSSVDNLENSTGKTNRIFEGDKDLPGFCVCISAKGAKAFQLSFTSKVDGKRKYYPIGRADEVTLKQAHRQARRVRDDIDDGVDPVIELKQARAEQKKSQQQTKIRKKLSGDADPDTFDELFSLYIAALERRGARVVYDYSSHYRNNIKPVIGDMHPTEVGFDECAKIISTAAGRGAYTVAEQCKAILSGAFGWALNAKMDAQLSKQIPDYGLKYNPAAAVSLKSIKADKEAAKAKQAEQGIIPMGERHLSEAEVRKVWKLIKPQGNRPGDMGMLGALTVMMLLATGQRVEEVLRAPWEEFDRNRKVWEISARRRKQRDKLKGNHIVPLNQFHLDILDQLQRISGRSKWLFPNEDNSAPKNTSAFRNTVARFCARKDIVHFTPRDIRRTFKTLGGEQAGISADDRDRLQGHGLGGIRKAYDKGLYLKEKRAAMDQWTQYLTGVLADNVVRLRK